jgi:hypothetical protein
MAVPLDPVGGEQNVEQNLQGFVQDVQGLYGEDLVAVLLYGSAAGGEHVPSRSDLNVAVVLRQLTPDLLRKAAGHLRAWHRRGFATPVFFDREFLHGSLDVFPVEFLDMQDRHRVLWGSDVLAGLEITRANLRRQCEQELRGKLLRLRQSYIESAHDPAALEQVLAVAVSSMAVLVRTLLRLGGADPSGRTDEVLARAEQKFGVSTEHLRKASQLKRGEIRLTGASLDTLYRDVLNEVQGLVGVVDGLGA